MARSVTSLCKDLSETDYYIVDAWRERKCFTQYGFESAWNQLQSRLADQRSIVNQLLDQGVKIESLNLMVPMQESQLQ